MATAQITSHKSINYPEFDDISLDYLPNNPSSIIHYPEFVDISLDYLHNNPSSIIQAFATTTIDLDLDEICSPTDLNNFSPDSGASQHI
jgi:hypothetical protein